MSDNPNDTKQWVFIYGNPRDGFRFVGPFECIEDVREYGATDPGTEWWIAELDIPASEGEPR